MYILFPVELLGDGTDEPQYRPINAASSSCPSRNYKFFNDFYLFSLLNDP